MAESGTRDEIGKALEGALTPEQLKLLMDEVLAIKKGARGWCGTCKKQVLVEISDAKAVTGALTDLMTQSWGRPQEQKTERSIVVNREVILVRDDDDDPVDVQGEPGAADSVLP